MGKKLTETNPYLRDPATREQGLWISAKTSSAIEGIHKPFKDRGPTLGNLKKTKKAGAYARRYAKSA